MKTLSSIFVFLGLLVCCSAKADVAGGTDLPSLKKMLPKLLSKKPDELILASNMPKSSNQTGFPICAGVAAKHLYLQYQCRTQKLDCQQLRLEEVPSSLMVAGVGISDASYKRTQSHAVVLYDDSTGDTLNSLRALQEMTKISTEACMPIEETWVSKFGSSSLKMKQAFGLLKSEYAENHAKPESVIDFDRWLRELRVMYGINTNESTLRAAVREDGYEKFLYDIMLKGCKAFRKQIELPDEFSKVKIGRWPDTYHTSEEYNYKGFIATIKKQLKSNRPVASSFCLYRKYSNGEECEGHTFVIFGYRKDCSATGDGCNEYLKTMSSWGPSYEKYYSDGWIDAEHYYEYLSQDHETLWLE